MLCSVNVIAGLIWSHFILSMPILPTVSALSLMQQESKYLVPCTYSIQESNDSHTGAFGISIIQVFCNWWCRCYMLPLGCIRACLHKDLLPTRVGVPPCLTTFTKCFAIMYIPLQYEILCSWPVRTLSFSHDSQMIATASEDLFIDIVSQLAIIFHKVGVVVLHLSLIAI